MKIYIVEMLNVDLVSTKEVVFAEEAIFNRVVESCKRCGTYVSSRVEER